MQRTLDTLDGLRPAPVPLEAEPAHEPALELSGLEDAMAARHTESAHAAPPRPRFVPPALQINERRGREPQEARPSIRVNLDRLDSLYFVVPVSASLFWLFGLV